MLTIEEMEDLPEDPELAFLTQKAAGQGQ